MAWILPACTFFNPAKVRAFRSGTQPAIQLDALGFLDFPSTGDPKLRPAAIPSRLRAYCANPALAIAGLALAIVLIRLPFNLNTGSDEAFYLIVGRQWLHGQPPYSGSFDVKPPLLFLLMAAAQALFDPPLLAAKALANAAAVFAGWGLYVFGRFYLGNLAGALAAIFYTFCAISLGSVFSTAESFMAPFTAFAMVAGFAAFSPGRPLPIGALLLSGLLSGAAACVKQTAVFAAVPLVLGLLVNRKGMTGFKAAAIFGAGSCIVPAGFAAYFLAIGHFTEFATDTTVAALGRAGTAYMSWTHEFGLLMGGFVSVLPVPVMAGLFWAERRTLRQSPRYPAVRFLWGWAAGASYGIFVTKELSIVYALPLMLPLCLLAGGFVEHVLGRVENPAWRLFWRAGTVAATVLYSCVIVSAVFLEGQRELEAAEGAAALMQREGKLPGENIFVADRDLLVYLTSGAEPPLSIFHPLHLLCPFPAKGADTAWSDSMKTRPPFVVLADPPVALGCEDPARRQAIRSQLARDYCELGNFESSATAWPGPFTVFGLKERRAGGCPKPIAARNPPANG
jgi:hypothetical protein